MTSLEQSGDAGTHQHKRKTSKIERGAVEDSEASPQSSKKRKRKASKKSLAKKKAAKKTSVKRSKASSNKRKATRKKKSSSAPGKSKASSKQRARRWRDEVESSSSSIEQAKTSLQKGDASSQRRALSTRIIGMPEELLELSGKESLDFTKLVAAEGIVKLKGHNKSEVLAELSEAAAKIAGLPDAQSVLRAVLETESRVNTKMGPNWATPHARLPDLPDPLKIVIGRSDEGVPYDSADEEPVNLVVLLLAREDARDLYLRALASIVASLRNEDLVDRVMHAKSARTLKTVLSGKTPGKRMVVSRQLPQVTRHLIRNMLRFAKDVSVGAIFLDIDAFERPEVLKSVIDDKTIIVTSQRNVEASIEEPARGVVRLPFEVSSAGAALRLSIVLAIGRGLVGRKERVLALAGPNESNDIDVMRLYDTKDFPDIDLGTTRQGDKVAAGVLERVIELASQIANEGREGSAVGCAFIIGQAHELNAYLRQLIINPFRGYRSEELNILDITLEETVKEFASIDGAFILSRNGQLHSAGTYLSPPGSVNIDLPSGLGSRHRSASMLTAACDCIAVVVSASTGVVTVFYEGKIVLAIAPDASRRVGAKGQS